MDAAHFYLTVGVEMIICLGLLSVLVTLVTRCCLNRRDTKLTIALNRILWEHYEKETETWHNALYLNLECTIPLPTFETDVINVENLLQDSNFQKHPRLLLCGKSGFGKSFSFRRIVNKWKEGKLMQNYILLYLKIKNMSMDSCIFSKCESLKNINITHKKLKRILSKRNSIVLLDDLDNLSKDKTPAANKCKSTCNHCITVNDLLENQEMFPELKLWATSLSSERGKEYFDFKCVVKLVGIQEKELNDFLKNMVSFSSETNETFNTNDNPLDKMTEWEPIFSAWTERFGTEDKISPLRAHLFVLKYLSSSQSTLTLKNVIHPQWNINGNASDITKELDLLLYLYKYSEENWRNTQLDLYMGKEITFSTEQPGYKREVVKELCKMLRKREVTLGKLTFSERCPSVKEDCLPYVSGELVFSKIQDFEDIIVLIKESSKIVDVLRFIDCKVPGSISEIRKEEWAHRKDLKLKVYLEEKSKTCTLDFEKGKWITCKS